MVIESCEGWMVNNFEGSDMGTAIEGGRTREGLVAVIIFLVVLIRTLWHSKSVDCLPGLVLLPRGRP